MTLMAEERRNGQGVPDLEREVRLRPANVINLAIAVLFRRTGAGVASRFVRHLIAGGIGTLLYTGQVALLVEVVKLDPVLSTVISRVMLELYTYIISRLWVYEVTRDHAYVFPRFVAVALVALLLSAGAMYLAVDVMNVSYLWGLVIAVLIVPPTNFLLNYYWAFK